MRRIILKLLPNSLKRLVFYYLRQMELVNFVGELAGPSPHLVKQNVISFLRMKYNYRIFIESGTFLGEMVLSQLNWFNEIHSIELDSSLFLHNKWQFRKIDKVKLWQGDSGNILGEILDRVNTPAILFLDGHYSGGITARGELICPIYKELSHVFASKLDHIVIIDDKRLFVGFDDYPTIDDLISYVKKLNEQLTVEFIDDLIIILPHFKS